MSQDESNQCKHWKSVHQWPNSVPIAQGLTRECCCHSLPNLFGGLGAFLLTMHIVGQTIENKNYFTKHNDSAF